MVDHSWQSPVHSGSHPDLLAAGTYLGDGWVAQPFQAAGAEKPGIGIAESKAADDTPLRQCLKWQSTATCLAAWFVVLATICCKGFR